jgi:hypothetical protein
MNIGQIKIVAWTAAALLTVALGAYVWSFAQRLEGLQSTPDREHVRSVLSAVQPVVVENSGQVDYADVRRLFHDLNWTGAVKVAPVVAEKEPENRVPEVTPVKDLLRVHSVMIDYSEPKLSSAFVRYKPKAGVSNKQLGASLVRVGESLAAPLDTIRIVSIDDAGVTFGFADEGRAHEALKPEPFDPDTQIVRVDADGVIAPVRRTGIAVVDAPAFVPGKTTRLGQDKFVLGSEDLRSASENYLDILANDVKMRQHRDPRTGRYDGVEITDVTPGSFAERHGASKGDVVKSINGHAVNSTSEAINFVKMNKDKYSTWEVVIENKGKTRTVTYESPQP